MSTGCGGGCLPGVSPQQQLQEIRNEAKTYAIKNEKPVAIYKEGYDWRFCEYEIAIIYNYPITEVLSKHNRSSSS